MFGTVLPGDKPDLLTSIENPFQQQPGEEQGLLTTEDVFLAPSALAQDQKWGEIKREQSRASLVAQRL